LHTVLSKIQQCGEVADLTTFTAAAGFLSVFVRSTFERGQSRALESRRNAIKFAMEVLREPFRSTAFIDLDGGERYGIMTIREICASDDRQRTI
jgi:hypothetical protein